MAEVKMNLLEKIAKARIKLGESDLKKTGYNPHAKFNYFQLDDFLPTARRICEELRFLPIESFEEGKAIMTVRDFDSDDSIVFECPAEKPNIPGANVTQTIGGMVTYLRRYLWMMLFEITEKDEFDATQGSDEGNKPNSSTRGTRPASQAAPKDDRPAEPPKPQATPKGTVAWKKTLEYFGYDFDKAKTDRDNADAFSSALDFVKPYGVKEAKAMQTIADDIAESIIQRIENMSGPENFKDDPLPA